MRLVPESNEGKIQFYQCRLAPWAEHAAELGTSDAEIAALAAKTEGAKQAVRAALAARNAARGATLRANQLIKEMETAGANVVKQIRAKAATADRGVYSLALIPAPEKPSPLGALGKPKDFTVELDAMGWLTLRWKCKNPRAAVGTVYQVSRRIGTGGKFQVIGTVGERKFIDTTVPPGSGEVEYQVQAVRSTSVGPRARYQVPLGSQTGTGALAMAFNPNGKGKAALIAA